MEKQKKQKYKITFILNSKIFLSDHRKSGFTLLEVLVSLALLGTALAVILQLFSVNLTNIAKSDDYVKAVIKAESKLREILDDDELIENSWSETTEDGYIIEASVTSTAEDRTENLLIELLEINLTIHWTKGVKEKELTLTTMKVLNKQI